MGLISACSSIATGIGNSVVAMSYLAEDECIDDAALYYSELEVNMRLEILNAEENHPGYDEYRFITPENKYRKFLAFVLQLIHGHDDQFETTKSP
jgi:hypothetical protein